MGRTSTNHDIDNYAEARMTPDGGDLFVMVRVYPTAKAMRKAISQVKMPYATKGVNARKIRACFIPNPKGRKNIGTIYYHKNRLGVGTVTHECVHAALSYLGVEAKRAAKILIDEEKLAQLTDGMTSAVYKWLYASNLIKGGK